MIRAWNVQWTSASHPKELATWPAKITYVFHLYAKLGSQTLLPTKGNYIVQKLQGTGKTENLGFHVSFLGGSKSPKTLYHFNPFAELCQRRGWQKSLAPRERGWGHWSGDRWQGNGGIVSKSRLWVNRPDGYLNTMESFVAEDMPS